MQLVDMRCDIVSDVLEEVKLREVTPAGVSYTRHHLSLIAVDLRL